MFIYMDLLSYSMIPVAKANEWISKVSETFADNGQFYDSMFYNEFAEWEERAWVWLEDYPEQFPNQEFTELIYQEVLAILSNARDEIEWRGQGLKAFNKWMEELIYLDAWLLWNATGFTIGSDLFSNVREMVLPDEDMFRFEVNDNEGYEILNIPLTQINVDPGAMVYAGHAKASSLHLSCDVPAIPSDLSASSTVARILDPELERNQWQRALIKNRVKHIHSFLRSGSSFFVNPIIIHLDDGVDPTRANVIFDDNNNPILQINFGNFCNTELPGYLSGSERPLKIIDGQHRVRGAARSSVGNILQLPFILIPKTYSADNAAKLFTEINTTSKELDKDHQLFLAYRFNIEHHDRDLTMGPFVPDKNNYHDRANRMAYLMAAKLSSNQQPLESNIQMLKSNGTSNCVDITKWLKYAKRWFLPGGPYEPSSELSEDYITAELSNYFKAWLHILGGSWILHGHAGWNNRSIFQYKTHFRVLLTRFSQIHKITRQRANEGVLDMEEFIQTLSPLSNLNSASQDLKQSYNKSSEFYWQCMDSWVEDAIANTISYNSESIMAKNIRSTAGQGILSPPASADNWTIMDDPRGNWPEGQARYIEIQRPTNCHRTLTIQILSGEQVLTGVSRRSINAASATGNYRVPIRANLIPDDVNEIQVRLEWKNAISTIERTITVVRPE